MNVTLSRRKASSDLMTFTTARNARVSGQSGIGNLVHGRLRLREELAADFEVEQFENPRLRFRPNAAKVATGSRSAPVKWYSMNGFPLRLMMPTIGRDVPTVRVQAAFRCEVADDARAEDTRGERRAFQLDVLGRGQVVVLGDSGRPEPRIANRAVFLERSRFACPVRCLYELVAVALVPAITPRMCPLVDRNLALLHEGREVGIRHRIEHPPKLSGDFGVEIASPSSPLDRLQPDTCNPVDMRPSGISNRTSLPSR